MPRVEASTTINCPIEEVFAFAADLTNNAKWMTGVIRAEVTSPGPVGVGTQFRYDGEFLGRKLETAGELTAYDPPRITAWKQTSGPFPASGSTTFETVPGGTRVVVTIDVEPGGFFKLATPLLVAQMRGQLEKDVKKLKELLEAA